MYLAKHAKTTLLVRLCHLSQYGCAAYPTKYVYIKQSTIVYVPRRNLDSPTPSLASECAPPPEPKGGGGGGTLACGQGDGSVSIPNDWR
jgi:hypothetical protein